MNLLFNKELVRNYTSKSQIARVLTESWVKKNSYCPSCGNDNVDEFHNNKPVADFYCCKCSEEFELKSKGSSLIGKKIVDGAYSTMIERINSDNNPNFFFLTYDKINLSVKNFVLIPKHFFVSDIIEKRKPLANTAKRAGWVGCNINLTKVPRSGRIFLVKNSEIINQEIVLSRWKETTFLREKTKASRGWILDVMNCVDQIPADNFELKDIYKFENHLKFKYPKNNFIKDKIRQQLQILRDKGIIEFVGRGKYKKIVK